MKNKDAAVILLSFLFMILFTFLPIFVKDPGLQWDFGLLTGLSFSIFVKYGDKIDE
jgi:hypothetical protein